MISDRSEWRSKKRGHCIRTCLLYTSLIAGTSFLLEAMQYVLAIGRSDITYVLTNTAGGLWGLAVYSIAARLIGNRIKANRLFSILAGIVLSLIHI